MNDAFLRKVDLQVIVINPKAIVKEDDSLLRNVESCRRNDGQITTLRRSLQLQQPCLLFGISEVDLNSFPLLHFVDIALVLQIAPHFQFYYSVTKLQAQSQHSLPHLPSPSTLLLLKDRHFFRLLNLQRKSRPQIIQTSPCLPLLPFSHNSIAQPQHSPRYAPSWIMDDHAKTPPFSSNLILQGGPLPRSSYSQVREC